MRLDSLYDLVMRTEQQVIALRGSMVLNECSGRYNSQVSHTCGINYPKWTLMAGSAILLTVAASC